jgi:hypothetical protein
MDARNKPDNTNFINSGAGDLLFEQAQYYARSYHHLPIRDEDKLERFFYLFAEHNFKLSQKWIAKSYDAFPKGLVNTGFKLFGVRDYTGCVAVTSDFRFNTIKQAIAEGAEQVLLIGSVNPHGIIHHKNYPNINFYYVSQGDSFRLQQEALTALQNNVYPNKKVTAAAQGLEKYGNKGDNMHYVDADFTKADMLEALVAQGFDPSKKTVCSLPASSYFTPEELSQMFANAKALLSHDSQLISLMVPPQPHDKRTRAAVKVGNKYGAFYKQTTPAEEAPQYLFDRGFYMLGQFPATSIYTTAGLTEAQARSANPQQNIYVSRPKVGQDVLPALASVPVMIFDWKKEDVPAVKNAM